MIRQIQEESRLLGRQIKEMETKLRKAPEGELKCARNGKSVKWYYYDDSPGRIYLPKKDHVLAEKLVLKKYNKTALEAAKRKKKAVDDCIEAYKECGKKTEDMISSDSCYRDLLLPQLTKLPGAVSEWAGEEYES